MLSYEPLKRTLARLNMNISDLREHDVHPEVIAKINRNEYITLVQVERICLVLDCPISDVVEVVR